MPLPRLLPLFPLPNVVLFPQVLLPLHIFEPRYRQLVKDVAAGDELIGMILLRGAEKPGAAGTDVYPVGCAGRMVRKVELADGRSNILLQGVREFVPQEQHFDRPYRAATVEWAPPIPASFRLEPSRRKLLVGQIRRFIGNDQEHELKILDDPTLGDEMLVSLFAFALDLPVVEKQSLLAIFDVAERAERLIETIDFHLLERECSPASEAGKIRVQ